MKEIPLKSKIRIYHPYWKWECFNSGFYKENAPFGKSKDDCESEFANYFKDLDKFNEDIDIIFDKWVNSCEHFLTNPSFNKVAWVGQACVCYSLGIPSKFKSGYRLVDKDQQEKANKLAKDKIEEYIRRLNDR